MRIASANIMNFPDMPRPSVVGDGKTAGSVAKVIGFQELGEQEDWDDVQTGLGPNYAMFDASPERLQIPIAYDKTLWSLVSSGSKLTVPVSSTINSPRYAVWGSFKAIASPEIEPIIVCNTHFVPGVRPIYDKPRESTVVPQPRPTYDNSVAPTSPTRPVYDTPITSTGGYIDPRPVYDLETIATTGWTADETARVAAWESHHAQLKTLISGWRAANRSVVLIGDFNRVTFPPFTPDQIDLFPNRIDKVIVFPGGTSNAETTAARGIVPMNSDHACIWTDVTIS